MTVSFSCSPGERYREVRTAIKAMKSLTVPLTFKNTTSQKSTKKVQALSSTSKNTITPKSTMNPQQLDVTSDNVTDLESEAARNTKDKEATMILLSDRDSGYCCFSHAVFLDKVTRVSGLNELQREVRVRGKDKRSHGMLAAGESPHHFNGLRGIV